MLPPHHRMRRLVGISDIGLRNYGIPRRWLTHPDRDRARRRRDQGDRVETVSGVKNLSYSGRRGGGGARRASGARGADDGFAVVLDFPAVGHEVVVRVQISRICSVLELLEVREAVVVRISRPHHPNRRDSIHWRSPSYPASRRSRCQWRGECGGCELRRQWSGRNCRSSGR